MFDTANISISSFQYLDISQINASLWWLIAAIEKKLSKSRKNFQNQEKNFGIQKNISESKKKKKWEVEKNISESKKMFQNQEIFCHKNQEKIFETECFYNIFA